MGGNLLKCVLCGCNSVSAIGRRSDFFSINDYAIFVADIERYNRTIHKCHVCGIQYIDPMYSHSDLESLYNTPKYEYFLSATDPCGNNLCSDESKRLLGVWKNQYISLGVIDWKEKFQKTNKRKPRFLDVGCGNGRLLHIFNDFGFEVSGIDLSERSVELTKITHSFSVENISLDDYHPNHMLDCISATHVIEHVRNPHSFMEKLGGLLSPGGLLIIETPLSTDFDCTEERYRDIYHTFFYDHYSLSLLATIHSLKYVNSLNLPFKDSSNNNYIMASFMRSDFSVDVRNNDLLVQSLRKPYDYLYNDSIKWGRAALLLGEFNLNYDESASKHPHALVKVKIISTINKFIVFLFSFRIMTPVFVILPKVKEVQLWIKKRWRQR